MNHVDIRKYLSGGKGIDICVRKTLGKNHKQSG